MNVLITVAYEKKARKDVQEALKCAHSIKGALEEHSVQASVLRIAPEDFDENSLLLIKKIQSFEPDCVFNIFEGFGQDAQKEIEFAGMLETMGIPFTGNGSGALNACLDKYACKRILEHAGVAVPQGQVLYAAEDIFKRPLTYPIFIKPCYEDASVGIDAQSFCRDQDEAFRVAKGKLALFPSGLIAEEFISGSEYSVAFIGGFPYIPLAISKIDYKEYEDCLPFLTYGSKWDEKSAAYNAIQPHIVKNTTTKKYEQTIGLCIKAAKVLGCRSYFRIDLREQGRELYIIDVNPNPDLNSDAGFARQAKSAGFSYNQLIYKIVSEVCPHDNTCKYA